MAPRDLLNRLVYLDRAYIADLYEVLTGVSPSTLITLNQGKKAGATIPVFSAEISAQETRAFSVSTFQMLVKALPDLEREPRLDPGQFTSGMPSQYGWIEGELTVFKAKSSIPDAAGGFKTLASDSFFHIRPRPGVDIAFITTPEYFSLGMEAFLRMQDTVLKEMSLPVRAFIRATAAQGYSGQWVGVPLVILEQDDEG
jgi:hypothetical protein